MSDGTDGTGSTGTITHELAAGRVLRHLNAGTLLRDEWVGGDLIESDDPVRAGYERACLLAAMVPECGTAGDASACPASLLPAWLAELMPAIDDSVSSEAWPGVIRRVAACVRRSGAIDDAGWLRLSAAVRLVAVREARSHVPSENMAPEIRQQVLDAIDGVIGLLEAQRRGDPIDESAAEATRSAEATRAAEAA
ncbi:MAG: hypothetical protein AAGF47_03835, partial [Planctomycetota bacterium]